METQQYLSSHGFNCTHTDELDVHSGNKTFEYHFSRNMENSTVYYGGLPDIEKYIYGYVIPCLTLITIVSNILMCSVLLKMRSPTNIILIGMAISDALTCLTPLPLFVYLYTAENYKEYVPMEWCYPDTILIHIASMFHSTSVWLTVFLSVHRFVKVCCGPKWQKLCSLKATIGIICAIYIFGIVSQAPRIFEKYFTAIELDSKLQPQKTVIGCIQHNSFFVEEATQNLYQLIYLTIRLCLLKIIPCICLYVFTILILKTLRRAQRQHCNLVHSDENLLTCTYDRTTTVLVVIISITLMVELITAITTVHGILRAIGKEIYGDEVETYIHSFGNLLLMLSYPSNFVVLCLMAKKFRDNFREMLRCNRSTKGAIALQSYDVPLITHQRALANV